VRLSDALRLATLAAIWGAAFIFIRVAAPALGPAWIAEGRLLIGGVALLAWFRLSGVDTRWRENWRFHAVVGALGTAIPFALYGYAGMHLPASTMAILNTVTPMFALLMGATLREERITVPKVAGLAVGSAGVWLLMSGGGAGAETASEATLAATAACLCASLAYASNALFVRRHGKNVPSRGTAVGAQLWGALVLLPLLPVMPPQGALTPAVLANLLALGLLASGVALVLYFRLIADIGVTRTQTVSLLVPAFGLLWGALFLGETITLATIGGGAMVVAGTVLVTRSR
jgi:drug/metabolite transporter (DMT)-like permease